MRLKHLAALLAIFFAAPFTACHANDSDFAYAVIRADCAPWDGPAIGVTLTREHATCKRSPFPNLRIYIWRNLPSSAPATVNFDDKGDNGGASLCTDQNTCQRAVSGNVSFDSFQRGRSASGSYEFRFSDGTVMKGKFSGPWCDERIMCG